LTGHTDTLSHLFIFEEIKYQHNPFFDSKSGGKDVVELTALSHASKDSDLYFSLRPFLILGRILGIIPISGLFWDNSKDLMHISIK